MEEFNYPLLIKATDENRNLKQIKAQWGDGSEAYTHDVPLDDPALQEETEDTATHVYSRRNLREPYSDYEITAAATDEEDAQSEELHLPVRVLSLDGLENDPCGTLEQLVSLRTVGDPIDTSSGAQTLRHDLLEVKGALPLSFSLRYNSLLLGGPGGGWEDSRYNVWLEILPQGSVMVHWSDNRYNLYQRNADGSYSPTHVSCVADTLTLQPDGDFILARGTSLVYRFGADGKLAALGDAQGRFVTFTYDTLPSTGSGTGRMVQVTEPSGAWLRYRYDTESRLAGVSDPQGRQVALEYDAQGRMVRLIDAAGQTTRYTYNTEGQVESGTDHEGRILFHNTFDTRQRIASQTDGNGHTLTLAYDDVSQPGYRVTSVTNSLGHTKKYTSRRSDLQLSGVQDELGRVTQFEYNPQGKLIARIDPNGHATRYDYDQDNDPATLDSVTAPAGAVTTLRYDAKRHLTNAVNAPSTGSGTGYGVTLEYGANNRLLRRTDAEGHVTQYEYNAEGQLIKVIKPRGGVMQYRDTNGLLTGVVKPNGQSHTLGYDLAGRLVSLIDAENHTTTLDYDGAGRISAMVNPLGQRISMTYDSRDKLRSLTDANGNVTLREYDNAGNLAKQINALGQSTQYAYDNGNSLIAATDARGNTTQLHYDAAGQLTSLTDALGHTRGFGFDAAGNLLESADALGHTVQKLNYNARDQVIKNTDALGHSQTFAYDELGLLSQSADPLNDATGYGYDSLNRLIQSIDALNGQSGQDFDEDGNRVTLTAPNGNQTWFSFDLSIARVFHVYNSPCKPTKDS